MKQFLYFDNAATTTLHPKVLEAMMPFLTEQYGNPSAVYSFARNARKAIEQAREQIAGAIGAQASEIFFTSSGTEANNWAIKGLANKGGHIITTAVEHHATSNVCEDLKKQGYEITYLPVDSEGFVSPDALRKAIQPNTSLITMIWGNNEIGTILPISEFGAIAKEKGIPFHVDAVQIAGHLPVNLAELPVDMLTISAHKFYGPKGVGALYIRKGTRLSPIMHGGAQEKKRRAGTENVPGIVGMGKAISIAYESLETELKRVSALRDYLIERIEKEIPKVKLNGARGDKRLPGNINFTFDYIEGESLLLLLDMQGCCASSGSACSSASLDPSHVIMALGVPHEHAHGSVRFSLGANNTQADIDKLMEILPKIVKQLRVMSPLAEGESYGL